VGLPELLAKRVAYRASRRDPLQWLQHALNRESRWAEREARRQGASPIGVWDDRELPRADRTGFELVVFRHGRDAYLCFEGSDSVRDWKANLQETELGARSFELNRGAIAQAVQRSSGLRLRLLGNSRGAALAQICAAKFPAHFESLQTFNPVAIERETLKHAPPIPTEHHVHLRDSVLRLSAIRLKDPALFPGKVIAYDFSPKQKRRTIAKAHTVLLDSDRCQPAEVEPWLARLVQPPTRTISE